MRVLCKVGNNIIFQNKTLLVMFYRHNKTFWYQFCNFKHFLKAENSEENFASSCVEFSIGLPCNPVCDWVTVGTSFYVTNHLAMLVILYFLFDHRETHEKDLDGLMMSKK